jgi:hypothetical protein
MGRGRDLRKILAELWAIVSKRSAMEDEGIEETIYLVIVGIQRAQVRSQTDSLRYKLKRPAWGKRNAIF